jgi:nucleotide sugar dehydrogenase
MNIDFIAIDDDLNINEIPEVIFGRLSARKIENRIPINYIPVLDKEKRLKSIFHISDLIPVMEHAGRQVLIFGQGFVGITLAMAMVNSGIPIVAFEQDEDLRREIESLKPRVFEPHLRDILSKNLNNKYKLFGNKLIDLERPTLFSKRIFIVAVGTPLKKKGNESNVDLNFVVEAFQEIAPTLKFGDLIVLRSTVPPGTTRTLANLIREKFNLRAGFDYHLAYAPERTVEGNAIAEVSRLPQLLGGFTVECTRQAANLFSEFVTSVVICENLEAAELGKLISNAYRDVRFAFSNEVAQLASRSEIDVIRLIEDVNLGYARNAIPFPSPGVGGPCLVKDSFMLGISDKEKSVILSARHLNQDMVKFTADKIISIARSIPGKILVIGVAFKGVPATNDLRHSTPIEVCRELIQAGLTISAVDAVATSLEIEEHGIPSFEEPIDDYNVICILNNNEKNAEIFRTILDNWSKSKRTQEARLVLFDPWGLVAPPDIANYKVDRFTLSSKID